MSLVFGFFEGVATGHSLALTQTITYKERTSPFPSTTQLSSVPLAKNRFEGLTCDRQCIAGYALSRVIHRIQSENLFGNPDWYIKLRIELRNQESRIQNPLQDELFIQLLYMPGYSEYSYLFRVSYRSTIYSACCRYFDPFILISSQNNNICDTFKTPSFVLSLPPSTKPPIIYIFLQYYMFKTTRVQGNKWKEFVHEIFL